MASNRLGMGPWDYIVGGLVLAPAAGLLALVDLTLVAWLTMFLAGVALAIGTVAQGVRVGMHAHRDDQRTGRFATTRPEPAALRPAG